MSENVPALKKYEEMREMREILERMGEKTGYLLKIRKCKLFKGIFFPPYITGSEAIRSEITAGRDVPMY